MSPKSPPVKIALSLLKVRKFKLASKPKQQHNNVKSRMAKLTTKLRAFLVISAYVKVLMTQNYNITSRIFEILNIVR